MNAERRHLLQIIALQSALADQGHTDSLEAFVWAVKQALIQTHVGDPVRGRYSIPETLMDIHITPRGREFIQVWAEGQMDAMLEEWLGE